MDGKRLEQAFALPRLEHAPAVGVDLDGAGASVAEQHAAEDAAADSSEEVELTHMPSP